MVELKHTGNDEFLYTNSSVLCFFSYVPTSVFYLFLLGNLLRQQLAHIRRCRQQGVLWNRTSWSSSSKSTPQGRTIQVSAPSFVVLYIPLPDTVSMMSSFLQLLFAAWKARIYKGCQWMLECQVLQNCRETQVTAVVNQMIECTEGLQCLWCVRNWMSQLKQHHYCQDL